MTLCMLEISFRHVQSDGLKAWPGLLNEIEESAGAATNIKKPQFALITSSKSFMELGQCLASSGVGRSVQKYLDLGVVSFSGIVGHPAARLKMKILQVIGGPLSTRFRAQDFVVCAALAASMDVWKVFEEEPRAMDQC